MPSIVLTEDQAHVLRQTTLAIELRDAQGRILARVPPPTEEEIIERIKGNRGEDLPRYSAQDVHARLLKLEEVAEQEELDESTVKEIFRRMLRAGEGG